MIHRAGAVVSMYQHRITTVRVPALLGSQGVPGGSILAAPRAVPGTKLSKRTLVLIAVPHVCPSHRGGCSHDGVQNRGVLNVENWDPYRPPNSNTWIANNLRATQKNRADQNSRIPEFHELSNRTRAAQRSKRTPRNHSRLAADRDHCRRPQYATAPGPNMIEP
jgi:hypothetical protein